MGSATPHSGVESCVGPKTVVMGFPRVVVECLLALTERARGEAAAVEGLNFIFWRDLILVLYCAAQKFSTNFSTVHLCTCHKR